LLTGLTRIDENAFQMPAAGAFEGPKIKPRVTRLNPRKIHSGGAFWAPRAVVYVRLYRRIFEFWHVRLQLIQAGALPNSQPSVPGMMPLSDDDGPCANQEQIANHLIRTLASEFG
jgi:hypothetical protein